MYQLQRLPTHPGEILREEFLVPLNLTQSALAKAIHSSFRSVNELVNEKRGITPEMALKLGKFFHTTPQLWLNLQNEYDLYKTLKKKGQEIETITECDRISAA
ncbi:MAG TPA: addiction module antidote protein, HigA family [Sulfuricurvum sp.]|nr:addiction module antidote protein, HigA family [Sulfuricurvum sp.]